MGVAPAGRPGRGLLVTGFVVAAVALVVGITCAVVVGRSVVAPLTDAMTDPSRPTPVAAQLSLRPGGYTVFELVRDEDDATTVRADMIVITGPGGARVTPRGFSSGNTETLDRDGNVYVGVARFDAPRPGPYHVRVDAPAGHEVLIAPSFGSGLGAVLGWFLGGLASILGLLLGVVLLVVGAARGRPRPAGPAGGAYAVPPAGWYPAPDAPARQRYWDGRAWTDQLR